MWVIIKEKQHKIWQVRGLIGFSRREHYGTWSTMTDLRADRHGTIRNLIKQTRTQTASYQMSQHMYMDIMLKELEPLSSHKHNLHISQYPGLGIHFALAILVRPIHKHHSNCRPAECKQWVNGNECGLPGDKTWPHYFVFLSREERTLKWQLLTRIKE